MKFKKLFKKYWWIPTLIIIIIGSLYFLYLWNCEDDWCFQYKWQIKKNTINEFSCNSKEDCILTSLDNQITCEGINNYEGTPIDPVYFSQPSIPYACGCDLERNKCMLAQ